MSNEAQILFPQKELKIGGQTVIVRELAWPHATEFLSSLGKHVGELYDSAGKVKFGLSEIGDVIKNSAELSTYLLEKSTGRPVGDFSLGAGLEVLDTALELNLSEEIMAKGKKLAGRFQGVIGGLNPTARRSAAASATPTPSSSKTDTPEAS
jgi:hypothetical protein